MSSEFKVDGFPNTTSTGRGHAAEQMMNEAERRIRDRIAREVEVAKAQVECLNSQSEAFDQVGAWAEESRIRLAEEGAALSLDERRRWHAIAIVTGTNGLYTTWEDDANEVVKWLRGADADGPLT